MLVNSTLQLLYSNDQSCAFVVLCLLRISLTGLEHEEPPSARPVSSTEAGGARPPEGLNLALTLLPPSSLHQGGDCFDFDLCHQASTTAGLFYGMDLIDCRSGLQPLRTAMVSTPLLVG